MATTIRCKPNVLITGTPGTGKTTLCELVIQLCEDGIGGPIIHQNIGELVKSKTLYEGWDEEFHSYVVDEDKVCDELEDIMVSGGNIVDHHGCDWFPERWFDLVVVLRTDNTVLFDRLSARGYVGKKLEHNIECEIMQVLVEEARDSYAKEIIQELQSNSIDDMEKNAENIVSWIQDWILANRGNQ